MSKKKIAVLVLASIFTCFLILNCVWGIYAYSYIKNYTGSLTASEADPTYFAYKDGVSYSATKPKYLNFINNLAVTDANENSLLVWKKLFSMEYGLAIGEKQYQMYVDKNGRPADKRNASNAEEVYNANTDTIDNLIKQANAFWTLE